MYDFYPEWGPARHRDEGDAQPPQRRPRYWAPATDARVPAMAGGPNAGDGDMQLPDDN
jgi:hypothetical protein